MVIKLIALDIDGTIVDSDSNVSPANEKAIREVVSRGIKVALVTGRHRGGTRKVIQDVGLDTDNTPLIVNNGAIVYLGERIIWRDFLSPDEADGVIKYTTKIPGVATTIFQPDQIHLHCNLPLDMDFLIDRLKAFDMDNCRIVDTPDELPREDVAKVMLVTGGSEKALEILRMWPKQLSHLQYTRSYPYLCEINSSTCDKGRGLEVLCREMGILPEEILAVGDGENDLSMLAFAKHAVFVRHRDRLPDLPPHVMVTPRGYHNEGVAWAISKIVLGQ
ncbi:MAG: HAD family hydrolase [Tepidanaerobacteraceae bacterium]|jgi:Cof subfamily protein (haloacid dehalogenase superfamily)|nr:HAD family phosphatase [Tepidanaerobacter sp.]HQE05909.1 HAD family hydrolase [Tepidanaerobacteraceae bacterium]